MAGAGTMVPRRRRLYSYPQTCGRGNASCGYGSVAAFWRRSLVYHPIRRYLLDALSGGRGDRLARVCSSASGRAVRTSRCEPPAGPDLGLLAPSPVFHSGSGYVWTIILPVRVAGGSALGYHLIGLWP